MIRSCRSLNFEDKNKTNTTSLLILADGFLFNLKCLKSHNDSDNLDGVSFFFVNRKCDRW